MGQKKICLQSCDGELYEIDNDVVSMCATVKNMLKGKSAFRNSLGGQFSIDGSYVILKKEGRVLASLTKNTEEEAIVALPDVKSSTLEKVIEYCKYHNGTTTEREKKTWDGEFVQVKQSILCELASASYYLDIKPLVNLTSRAIATQISASSLATRCRLQRKFSKKKQQDEKDVKNVNVEDDNRSLEELVEFIEEGKKGKVKALPSSSSSSSSTPTISNTGSSNGTTTATNSNQKKKAKKTKKKKSKLSNSQSTSTDVNNEESNSTTKMEDSNTGDIDEDATNSNSQNSNSSNHKKNTSTDSGSKESLTQSAFNGSEDDNFVSDNNNNSINNDNSANSEEEVETEVELEEKGEDIDADGDVDGDEDGQLWSDDDDLDPKQKADLDKEVEEFRLRLESMNTNTITSKPRIPLPVSASSFVSSLAGVGVH